MKSNYNAIPKNKSLVIKTRSSDIDLAPIKPRKHTQLTKGNDKEVAKENKSKFRRQLRKIRRLRDEQGYDEKYIAKVLQSMHDLVLDLIPIAEENFRTYRNERATYALNTYFNQSREILNDLRAIEDFHARADKIKQIVFVHFTYILQNLTDEMYKLKASLSDSLAPNDMEKQDKIRSAMERMLRTHTKFYDETKVAIDDKIDKLLVKG